MVREQSKRKTKIDFDFQAINDLKTKQTANKVGMRSSADKSCRNLGGGGDGLVERRGSTGEGCVRG